MKIVLIVLGVLFLAGGGASLYRYTDVSKQASLASQGLENARKENLEKYRSCGNLEEGDLKSRDSACRALGERIRDEKSRRDDYSATKTPTLAGAVGGLAIGSVLLLLGVLKKKKA
ncbi:MAG: hypothetical protein U0271_28900 [Polyangiaceae bacterium]